MGLTFVLAGEAYSTGRQRSLPSSARWYLNLNAFRVNLNSPILVGAIGGIGFVEGQKLRSEEILPGWEIRDLDPVLPSGNLLARLLAVISGNWVRTSRLSIYLQPNYWGLENRQLKFKTLSAWNVRSDLALHHAIV